MAGCEKYNELISAAIDGELTPEEEKELNAHLKACKECSSLFDTLKILSGAFHDMLVQPPDTLAGAVMNRIGAQPLRSKKKRTLTAIGRLAAAAAVVALVLFAANPFSSKKSDAATQMYDASLSYREEVTEKGSEEETVAGMQNGVSASGDSEAAPQEENRTEADCGDEGAAGKEAEDLFGSGPDSPPEPNPETPESGGADPTGNLEAIPSENPALMVPYSANAAARDIWVENQYDASSYYCLAIINGSIPERLETCEVLLQTDGEVHYLVPAEAIEELYRENLISELLYDNMDADYGIIVVYIPIT